MRKAGTVRLILIVSFFAVALVSTHYTGTSNRVYLESRAVEFVSLPEQAFTRWAAHGVGGRVEEIRDPSPHAQPRGQGPSRDNFVYRAIRKNIIREVNLVIPDAYWEVIDPKLSGVPGVRRTDRGDYRATIEGAPFRIMPLQRVRAAEEESLLFVNGEHWDTSQMQRIISLVKTGVLKTDCIIFSGDIPAHIGAELHE